MTDMTETGETQHTTVIPLAENHRMGIFSVQWLLERHEDKNTPIYHRNRLNLFICGEAAFTQIAQDLKRAKHSVEIICWGFDPAMELTRNKTTWPRGDTWGGLLKDVAEGKYNGGKPVQVRLLSWYGFIGNKGTNNMPGYGSGTDYELKHAASQGMAAALAPGGKVPPLPPPTDPRDQRELFNAQWYREAFKGTLKNLQIRTRDMPGNAVEKSLAGEPGKRGFIETEAMKLVATDHQKTILIDYEHEGGADAVGYVMGLNSVTDYWDTPEHLFHDPRRGEAWEGANDTQPGLKPYQDYACRLEGVALVAVSKNFTDAWNRAKGHGDKLPRTHDLQKPPAGLAQKLKGERSQRVQIVRTQPEEGDKSIRRVYRQATSFARHYLYVENQYFQHTDWAQQLKKDRQGFVQGWQNAGRSPADLPILHVMVVIPTPERSQMVPRTYDTVKALGQGSSMPNQDQQVEEELKAHAKWEAYAKEMRAKGEAPSPYAYPGPLSAVAQSAKDAGDKANVAQELNVLGMRTLVGSLWTFDHHWRATQAKAIEQAEQQAQVEKRMPKAAAGAPATPAPPSQKALLDKLASQRYREIYIHSKLMVIDDSFFTLGSANLNLRSMAVDAEMNVASDDAYLSEDLRRRVWALHTGGADKCNPAVLERKAMAEAFRAWVELMGANKALKKDGIAPTGFLFPFEDKRTSRIRVG
jgi:phosphatidylserine/phosphatidylglycerophosphate/cardiolipin synthase-like enzyme